MKRLNPFSIGTQLAHTTRRHIVISIPSTLYGFMQICIRICLNKPYLTHYRRMCNSETSSHRSAMSDEHHGRSPHSQYVICVDWNVTEQSVLAKHNARLKPVMNAVCYGIKYLTRVCLVRCVIWSIIILFSRLNSLMCTYTRRTHSRTHKTLANGRKSYSLT